MAKEEQLIIILSRRGSLNLPLPPCFFPSALSYFVCAFTKVFGICYYYGGNVILKRLMAQEVYYREERENV